MYTKPHPVYSTEALEAKAIPLGGFIAFISIVCIGVLIHTTYSLYHRGELFAGHGVEVLFIGFWVLVLTLIAGSLHLKQFVRCNIIGMTAVSVYAETGERQNHVLGRNWGKAKNFFTHTPRVVFVLPLGGWFRDHGRVYEDIRGYGIVCTNGRCRESWHGDKIWYTDERGSRILVEMDTLAALMFRVGNTMPSGATGEIDTLLRLSLAIRPKTQKTRDTARA